MLEWLIGKKRRRELPEYSRLRAVPTRELPSDLVKEEESGQSFNSRREAIEQELRDPAHLPRVDAPLFTVLASGGDSVVTMPLPNDSDHCLPVFSTRLRAADYKGTLLTSGPAAQYQYVALTPIQFLRLLRQLAEKGITTFALDRCPRCPIFTTTGVSLKSPDPLLMVWAVHKATELARMELYVNYALNAARAGRLETAREVALETVGHVDLENPRPHFLLGEIGLALGDRTLRQEAREFLSFLKHDRWLERLDEVVRKGRPGFENLD